MLLVPGCAGFADFGGAPGENEGTADAGSDAVASVNGSDAQSAQSALDSGASGDDHTLPDAPTSANDGATAADVAGGAVDADGADANAGNDGALVDADGGGVLAPCSPAGWCLSGPFPQGKIRLPLGTTIWDTWGSATNDVWAVGDDQLRPPLRRSRMVGQLRRPEPLDQVLLEERARTTFGPWDWPAPSSTTTARRGRP